MYCDITGSVLWAQNNRIYSTTDNGVWLSIDHVVPVALGGGDELTNLEWACQDCNRRKGSRDDWTSPNRYLIDGERRRADT